MSGLIGGGAGKEFLLFEWLLFSNEDSNDCCIVAT